MVPVSCHCQLDAAAGTQTAPAAPAWPPAPPFPATPPAPGAPPEPAVGGVAPPAACPALGGSPMEPEQPVAVPTNSATPIASKTQRRPARIATSASYSGKSSAILDEKSRARAICGPDSSGAGLAVSAR